MTALLIAVANEYSDIVTILLDRNVEIDKVNKVC